MNISALFIKRPVMTTLVMAGILLFGFVSYRLLPVSDLPTVDYPTISVGASLPGASAETMASSVATPLEKQFSTIAGIDAMSSTSSQGLTSITLQFTLDRNIDAAAQDVQAAIAKTLGQLPQGMIPPSYGKVDPSASPILYLALQSPTLPLPRSMSTARPSSPSASPWSPASRRSRSTARRSTPSASSSTRRRWPSGRSASTRWSAPSRRTTSTCRPAFSGARTRRTPCRRTANSPARRPSARSSSRYRNGAPVRLQDIGQVMDGVQDSKVASWFNGDRAIVLAVQRQPGTNTVAVAQAVKKAMVSMESQFPASVKVETLFDRSLGIQASVSDVQSTLMLTLVLVVLVIFLFLRNIPATVIPSLALPMSLFGTFAVMYLLGYSLDNLSLMALTLSVGFVVDDAIVMLENIVRHIERGTPVREAALTGSREIGFTILSMTISLVAVFIPVLFLGGLIGRLFHEFAVTIGVAILVSGFVSLTLTPMLCSRFLKAKHEETPGRFFQAIERFYQRAVGAYERSLIWVMGHRPATMLFSLVILSAPSSSARWYPRGSSRPRTKGRSMHHHRCARRAPPSSPWCGTSRRWRRSCKADPYVEGFMSSLGAGGRSPTINQGRMFVHLKPRKDRPYSADQWIAQMAPKLNSITGIRAFLINPPHHPGRRSQHQEPVPVRAAERGHRVALQVRGRDARHDAEDPAASTDVTTDLQIRSPQVQVEIDRDRAASLGVNVSDIESALYNAYGARQVSTIYTPNNQYWVIMELLPQYQRDLSALSLLYIRSRAGELVPLASLAKVTPSMGPLTVDHSGQMPAVTLSFNLRAGSRAR